MGEETQKIINDDVEDKKVKKRRNDYEIKE